MWKNFVAAVKNGTEKAKSKASELKDRASNSELLEKVQTKMHDLKESAVKAIKDNSAGFSVKPEKIELYYVGDRIITCAFPGTPSFLRRTPRAGRTEKVAAFLRERHGDHYMIWNLSEEKYDVTLFDGQVIEHKFPGHPAPPLDLLCKLCSEMENWIEADAENVAVVHCLTGRGRTAVVVSCLLAWMGEADSPMGALEKIAEIRGMPVEELTIPSQRTYIEYFGRVMEGVCPKHSPVLLSRISVRGGVPRFGVEADGGGVRAVLQIFQSGKMLFRTESRAIPSTVGEWSWEVGLRVKGDVLVRCRHLVVDDEGQIVRRETVFRTAIHTGYTAGPALVLGKGALDSACHDERVPAGMAVELVLADSGEPAVVQEEQGEEAPLAEVEALCESPAFWREIARRRAARTAEVREAVAEEPGRPAEGVFIVNDEETAEEEAVVEPERAGDLDSALDDLAALEKELGLDGGEGDEAALETPDNFDDFLASLDE